jgi:hypothetical protein
MFIFVSNNDQMSSKVIFEGLGDLISWTTEIIFENVGNMFNTAAIILGFVGLFFWLNTQKKFNAKALNNPDQLK